MNTRPKDRYAQPEGGHHLRRFQLYGTLTRGGSAQAKLLSWSTGAELATVDRVLFTVFDAYKQFRAVAGVRGVAMWMPDTRTGTGTSATRGRWEIMSLALFGGIQGLATSAVSAATSTFTIDNVSVDWGVDPRTNPLSSSETVSISNAMKFALLDNALVYAKWSQDLQLWQIYQGWC